MKKGIDMWAGFERYTDFNPDVPVYKIVRSGRPTIHRFFDSSPVSPSGRLIGLTEFPFEDRLPEPGDKAAVVVVDLISGDEVYRTETAAWDTQVGAQVQWGRDDHELYFNRMDVETWTPYGVCVDIGSGDEVRLDVTVYHVSETGQYVFSPDLIKISIAQAGYGVCVPSERVRRNFGASKDDGIFVLDRHSGEQRLLLSFSEIYDALRDRFVDLDLSKGAFYGFHTKVNRQSDKVIFIIRWLPHESSNGKTKNYLITCDVNGGDINMAIDSVRWGGGHHPNWCPDGRSIVMNLVEVVSAGALGRLTRFLERVAKRVGFRYFSNAFCMRFAIFDYKGSDFRIVAKSHFGSGHPSLSFDGRHIVTDCYPYERVAFGDGTVPLRLIDIVGDASRCVVRVPTRPNYEGRYREYRIDPHPVWDREGKLLIFNAAISGQRSVFVADLSGCL